MRAALLAVVFTACGAQLAAPPVAAPAAVAADPNPDATATLALPLGATLGPDWNHRVIYLAMPDRFFNGDPTNDELGSPGCHDPQDPQRFHGGDYQGLTQKLPYLTELGVDAIWITPAYRQVGAQAGNHCGYHGYWSDLTDPDDGAIEPKLGTAAELSALIDAAHANGQQLILDMVVNHTGNGSRLSQQHPGWFHAQQGCGSHGDPAIWCPLDGHPDFAQEQPEVAAYLDAESTRWVQNFALDGIRMDTARHVYPPYFRDHWLPAVRGVRPQLFTVAEVFLEGGAGDLRPILQLGFDSAFNFPLRRRLVNAFGHGGSVDDVANAVQDDLGNLGLDRARQLVSFVDNHDVQRFVNEPGLAVSEAEIQRRYQLALTAIFTLPGIPQLYMGDELGRYGGPDPDNRRDMPDWGWTAAGRAVRHPGDALPHPDQIFARVQKLIALRHSSDAIALGDYGELWRQNGPGHPNVFAFARHSGNQAVVVVLNNDHAAVTMNMQAPQWLEDGGQLAEQLGDGASALTVSQRRLTLQVPAQTAAVYLR